MSRPYGDCYQASLESAEELQLMKSAVEQSLADAENFKKLYNRLGLTNPISIVHGTAVPANGLDKGRTIVHAWVEVGADAVETSNGQLLRIPTANYYANHGITPIKRYSVPEARSLVTKHGKYAAWHLIEAQQGTPADPTPPLRCGVRSAEFGR